MHLLIAAALAAQAANPLCADVARLVDGAAEPVPFTALSAAKFAPALLGQATCNGYPRVYLCSRNLLPAGVTEAGVAAEIAACLPDAKISVEKRSRWAPKKTIVRGSGLVFALDESGTPRSHVGRSLFITVRSEADAAAALD